MVLHAQQRVDHIVGKTDRAVGRPGAHHALHRTVAEGLHEGEVIGDLFLPEILKDRKFARAVRHDAAADMLQIVVEKMEVRALQETVRLLAGRHAEALDGHAAGALPGEAQRVVKRMQHREGQVHAREWQAGGRKPLAETAHDVFKVVTGQRRIRQPFSNTVQQNGGYAGSRSCSFLVLSSWRTSIPKGKNNPDLPIHDEQITKKSGCTSGIIVSTIADDRL